MPVPLSPSMRTVLLLSATIGNRSSTRRIAALLPTMAARAPPLDVPLRRISIRLRSRKVSTPPVTRPSESRSTLAEMLTGIRSPCALRI